MKVSFTPGPGIKVMGHSDGVTINAPQKGSGLDKQHLLYPSDLGQWINPLVEQLYRQAEIIEQQHQTIQEQAEQIQTTEMKHSLSNQLVQLYDLYKVRQDLLNVAEENIEAARLNMQISEDKFRVYDYCHM